MISLPTRRLVEKMRGTRVAPGDYASLFATLNVAELIEVLAGTDRIIERLSRLHGVPAGAEPRFCGSCHARWPCHTWQVLAE